MLSVFNLVMDIIIIKQEHAFSGIQVSPAWILDQEMRRRNLIYSLKDFYFLLYRRRYFLFVSELI